MIRRHSSNPVDKVCSIAFPFQKRGSRKVDVKFPIYDPNIPVSVAWDQLIPVITSTQMHVLDVYPAIDRRDLGPSTHGPTIQLLRLFPHPSRHRWFPSWTQVLQYPDVSVRDNNQGPWHEINPGPDMKDYSLKIASGRIYRDCSLQLSQLPTPEKQAVYSCTMGNKGAQLRATVPGIELHIDSATKYVLVDISPDISLWPWVKSVCQKTDVGHEHLPIWQESVVLVCKEVDTLPRPAEDSSKVMEYYLRRITTLEWDCRLSANPGTIQWLPFEPSLVHMQSIVCSARGAAFTNTLFLPQRCFVTLRQSQVC